MAFPNAQVPNQMLAKTPQGLGSLNPAAPQQNSYQAQPTATNAPGGFGIDTGRPKVTPSGQTLPTLPQVQQPVMATPQQPQLPTAVPQTLPAVTNYAPLTSQTVSQPVPQSFDSLYGLKTQVVGAQIPQTLPQTLPQVQQPISATPTTQIPSQGLGGLAAYGPQAAMYKAGGSVGLKDAAKQLAAKGRGGDTILAHINPQEAAMLKRMGGSGTINPHTGLPEFLFGIHVPIVDDVIGVAKKGLSALDDAVIHPITHAVQNVVQDVAKATGPVGQIAASYFGGPVGAALYAGLAGEDGFNFKRGLMAGAMTWGAQNLGEGLGGTESTSSTPTPAAPGPGAVGLDISGGSEIGLNPGTSAGQSTGNFGIQGGAPVSDVGSLSQPNPSFMDKVGNAASNAWNSASTGMTNAWNDPSSLIPKNALANQDLGNIATNAGKVLTGDTSAWTGNLTKSVLPMFAGATGIKAIDEMEKFKKEQEELEKEQEAKRRMYSDMGISNLRNNPWQFAEGGAVDDNQGIYGQADGLATGGSPINYAAGGVAPPRFLNGGGDGMSDSIPATIDGKQPARIADGEFIVPADVVSHLGNGSSKAGAKQLYSMMDKVRTARTGTKQQGKQINPKKYLPA